MVAIVYLLFIIFLVTIGHRANQVQACIKSNFYTLPTKVAELHLPTATSYTQKELDNHNLF